MSKAPDTKIKRPTIEDYLVAQKNNFQIGEQPLVLRDTVTDGIINATVIVDPKGNIFWPHRIELLLGALVELTKEQNDILKNMSE